jgi:hypothetical protein
MIDFVNLVDSLLEESEETVFLLETQKHDEIFNHHIKGTRYGEIAGTLKTKYGTTLAIPPEADFALFLRLISQKSPRGGANAKDFPNLAEWFPAFDLLCLFNSEHSSWAPPDDATKSQATFNAWKLQVQNYGGSVPLEYTPMSPEARIVKSSLNKDINLGQLRVESIKDDFPFFEAASYLINVRREVASNAWPKSITKLFDTDGKKIIMDIMYNPKKIITGTYKIDKKLEAIFDFGITRSLVSMSLAFYNMFKQELGGYVDLYINQINPTPHLVIGGIKYTIRDLLTEARVKAINNLTDNAELYKLYMGNPGQLKSQKFDCLPFIIQTFDAVTVPDSNLHSFNKVSSSLPLLDPKPYFKEDNFPQEFFFNYKFSNLKAAAQGDYKEAKELYKDFIEMGEYIKQKTGGKLLDGATQIAKGLTLGVKNMGT